MSGVEKHRFYCFFVVSMEEHHGSGLKETDQAFLIAERGRDFLGALLGSSLRSFLGG